MELLSTLAVGIASGVSVALSGFAKSSGEKFDYTKFATTAIIGGLAGLASAGLGLETTVAYQYLINAGAVTLLENAIKAIKRKIK